MVEILTLRFATHVCILTSSFSKDAYAFFFTEKKNVPLPNILLKYVFTFSVFQLFLSIYELNYLFVPLSYYAINWDGSFQAYPTDLIIINNLVLTILNESFGTLNFDLGCFPLDYGPLHPKSD